MPIWEVTGIDLGPVALLGAALLIAGFGGTAFGLRRVPADGEKTSSPRKTTAP
ncbi:hypothetical protein [Sphaerisporangium fuscum]|uniref:hypothetical protein n=1 Tax=Sphaerisporangium fuscum TaxID=2835868 RepID=UPI001BDD87F3|nr:hypothetical protein [Sphaerisporangium fuscum]